MPPTKDDNLSERFARIEALMEEYRIKHEDLEAYVSMARQRATGMREQARRQRVEARSRRQQTKPR